MKKIKQVIRERLPETNSSSSHSVVICVNKNYLTDTLPMDDNGVIHVPRKDSFGWEYEKYNDAMTKLQYVCGILWRFKSNRKSVKKLKNIIMNYTGATDVVFEWEEERLLDNDCLDPEEYENEEDDFFYNSGAPEIDHNSSDIFPEIMESSTSIKNFIFNTKSWLYLGNDNSESPENFYEDETEIKEHNITVSVDYGGKIGRVDFEYNESLGEDIMSMLSEEDLINDIVYDSVKKEFEMGPSTVGWRIKEDDDKFHMRQYNLGDSKLYWVSNSIKDEIIKRISDIQSKNDKDRKSFSMLPFSVGEIEESIFKDLLSDPKWSDHYVSIPFTVTIDEFGKIL